MCHNRRGLSRASKTRARNTRYYYVTVDERAITISIFFLLFLPVFFVGRIISAAEAIVGLHRWMKIFCLAPSLFYLLRLLGESSAKNFAITREEGRQRMRRFFFLRREKRECGDGKQRRDYAECTASAIERVWAAAATAIATACVSPLQVRKENQQNRTRERAVRERERLRECELARYICKGRNFPESRPYRALRWCASANSGLGNKRCFTADKLKHPV